MRADADDAVTAAIEAAIFGVIEAAGDLPFERLRPGEPQVLGGSLFAQAPRLVALVGRALEGDRRGFPDVPLRGADLLRGQRRAAAWRRLRDLCGALQALAGDCFLREEAALCGAALTVVRHVEAEAALPFQPLGGPAAAGGGDGGGDGAALRLRRGVALLPALLLLDRRQRHKERARQRSAGAGAEGGAEVTPRRRPRSRRGAGVLARERLEARLAREGRTDP